MKVRLGGQKFQTDDGFRRGILNWLRHRNKKFYADGVSNLARQ
jgi:hypothetical protein